MLDDGDASRLVRFLPSNVLVSVQVSVDFHAPTVLQPIAVYLGAGLFRCKNAVKEGSQGSFALVIVHTSDFLLKSSVGKSVHDDVVGECFCLASYQVLLRRSAFFDVLVSVEDGADVLTLVADYDDDQERDHYEAHDDALDVDPEDLPSVPSVK